MKKGFTLIELLVVISIIATIIAFAVPNFLGARQRASDTKKKAELIQLKNALRLYYNDYQKYPCGQSGAGCDNKNGSYIFGCGTNTPPDTQCSTSFDANGVTYMKILPDYNGTGFAYGYNYCSTNNQDDFRITIQLDNASDPDIATSQTRCPVGPTYCNTSATGNLFVVCAD